MKNRFMMQGLLYIILAIIFVYFAIQEVNMNGWSVLAYVIIILATFDFITGFRFIWHEWKKRLNKK